MKQLNPVDSLKLNLINIIFNITLPSVGLAKRLSFGLKQRNSVSSVFLLWFPRK